jgi:ABC-type amino acid transport substrate-binding protein
MLRTVRPGTLIVQSAYPDPPFELMRDGAATGFDIELMRAVCGRVGLDAMDRATEELRAGGEFRKLQAQWPGVEASL